MLSTVPSAAFRQPVACDDDIVAVEADLDDLVHERIFSIKRIEQAAEQSADWRARPAE